MTMLNDVEAEILWSQRRYESGVYLCQVTREGDFGELTVTLEGNVDHILHREQVKIDKVDLDAWRRTCVQVIIDPDLRVFNDR